MNSPLAALLTAPPRTVRDSETLPHHVKSNDGWRKFSDPAIQALPISIDLLIINAREEVLLGLRNNRPAQNFWFLPGGRVRKDERISGAFARIARQELDLDMVITDAELHAVRENPCPASVETADDLSSHFITLVYSIARNLPLTHRLPRIEHRDYRWMTPSALRAANDVHPHVKKYFGRGAASAR